MGKGDRRPGMKMKRRIRQQKKKEKERRRREQGVLDKKERMKIMESAKPEPEKEMKPEPNEVKPEPEPEENFDIRDGIPDRKTLDANLLVGTIRDLDYDGVKYMLETAKVDPNVPDRNGRYALIEAAKKHDSKMVRLLMETGADPEVTDSRGRTALHYIR